MKNKIFTFTSAKTAGASTLSLNFALLYASQKPGLRVAFIEAAGLASQRALFPAASAHHWGELTPFYDSPEWESALLTEVKTNLGVDVFWSPLGADWPEFSVELAQDLWSLWTTQYEVIFLDLDRAIPAGWLQFFQAQAGQIFLVGTADPLGLQALEAWQKQAAPDLEVRLLINQASPRQEPALRRVHHQNPWPLLGVLPQDVAALWQQTYQAFPVALQSRSKLHQACLKILSQWTQ